MRTLRIGAAVEAGSIVVLLGNLVTLHVGAVASLVGPLHGTAYLVVIVATMSTRAAGASGARRRAVVPGIGGLLALRRLEQHAARAGRPAPTTDARRE